MPSAKRQLSADQAIASDDVPGRMPPFEVLPQPHPALTRDRNLARRSWPRLPVRARPSASCTHCSSTADRCARPAGAASRLIWRQGPQAHHRQPVSPLRRTDPCPARRWWGMDGEGDL